MRPAARLARGVRACLTSRQPSSSPTASTTSSARSAIAATASSGRRCATARSSTTRSSRRPTLPDRLDGRAGRRRRYRLERRDDEARFGYAVGPHSWKQFLLPARVRLWQARRGERRLRGRGGAARGPAARAASASAPCELHAIAIQDRVFLGGALRRPRLRRPPRRTRSSSPSTAASPAAPASASRWAPGPKARGRLRPRADRDPRRRAPLPRRGRHASAAPRCSPSCRDADGERRRPRRGRRRGRRAPPSGWAARSTSTDLRDLLARNLEHPRWDDVAERCLTLRQLHARLPDLLLHARSRT